MDLFKLNKYQYSIATAVFPTYSNETLDTIITKLCSDQCDISAATNPKAKFNFVPSPVKRLIGRAIDVCFSNTEELNDLKFLILANQAPFWNNLTALTNQANPQPSSPTAIAEITTFGTAINALNRNPLTPTVQKISSASANITKHLLQPTNRQWSGLGGGRLPNLTNRTEIIQELCSEQCNLDAIIAKEQANFKNNLIRTFRALIHWALIICTDKSQTSEDPCKTLISKNQDTFEINLEKLANRLRLPKPLQTLPSVTEIITFSGAVNALKKISIGYPSKGTISSASSNITKSLLSIGRHNWEIAFGRNVLPRLTNTTQIIEQLCSDKCDFDTVIAQEKKKFDSIPVRTFCALVYSALVICDDDSDPCKTLISKNQDTFEANLRSLANKLKETSPALIALLRPKKKTKA